MNIPAVIILLIIIPMMCLSCSAYLVYNIVLQIRRQMRLYSTITLVELKARKGHYYVFIAVSALIAIYAIFQLFDSRSPDTVAFSTDFHFAKWQTNIVLGSILLFVIVLLGLLLSIVFSKCAIVDKGVYTGMSYIEWHYLYDYIIDMQNISVVLTTNKSTFLTILGTTPPLRVARNDIQKLIFILNKNKNKFNQAIEDK